jgi:hypothetical protein
MIGTESFRPLQAARHRAPVQFERTGKVRALIPLMTAGCAS